MPPEDEKLPKRFGPFLLMRLLGAGGMGSAYLARHPDWKSGIVVKRMHPHFMTDETIFKRFVHEAKVATYVRHDNVAPLVAMGTIGEEPFIATEFVFGIGVSQIIQRVQANKTPPLPYPVALRLALGLTRAVEAVHDARHVETGESLNLIHRDIGSRNVLIGFDGRLQLIDLGLGKSILADWQTAANVFAGSPDYMPPEQALGQPVDRRADVYSTSVTIWELVVGRKRVQEPTVPARIKAAINRHAEQLRPHRSEASLEFEDAIKRAMARDVAVRTPSISILRKAVEAEVARVGPVRRKAVRDWLDVACATIIARERRSLEEAERAAYDLHLPPVDTSNTEYLAAQPILFMPPAVRGDSGLDEVTPPDGILATGIEKIFGSTRAWQNRLARRLQSILTLYGALDDRTRIAVNVVPALLVVLLVVYLALPSPDSSPAVAPITVAAPPPAQPVAPPSPPPPSPPPAIEEEVVDLGTIEEARTPPPPVVPRRPSMSPSRVKRKRELVSRLRRLRKKRFDMQWQRRLTRLGTRLSRARTKVSLDRLEGQIRRLEKSL